MKIATGRINLAGKQHVPTRFMILVLIFLGFCWFEDLSVRSFWRPTFNPKILHRSFGLYDSKAVNPTMLNLSFKSSSQKPYALKPQTETHLPKSKVLNHETAQP